MNYNEFLSACRVNPKHLQQGQIAILTDAIGPTEMIELVSRADPDTIATVADTILMIDMEKWIRGLPGHEGTKSDQNSMRLSPVPGVNITFDRYVMTKDGFLPRREFVEYKIRKRIEVFREMSKEGKLYVAKSSVNGGDK